MGKRRPIGLMYALPKASHQAKLDARPLEATPQLRSGRSSEGGSLLSRKGAPIAWQSTPKP